MRRRFANESGSALLISLIIIAVWSIAMFAILSLAETGFKVNASANDERELVWAAEAGAEGALAHLTYGGSAVGCPDLSYPGTGGQVSVTVVCDEFEPPQVDCDYFPNDESCPPDCDAEPDHPDCPPNCTLNPDDSRCPPDCDADPDHPDCPPDCDANPNHPACPPDCDANPDDSRCPPDCDADPDHPDCPPDCDADPDDSRCPPNCVDIPVDIECVPEAYSVSYDLVVTAVATDSSGNLRSHSVDIRVLLDFPAGDVHNPEEPPVADVTVIRWTADRT